MWYKYRNELRINENKFKLAKKLIEDGTVDVNIKDDCGDNPPIDVCK
jgi:hypothetical protein